MNSSVSGVVNFTDTEINYYRSVVMNGKLVDQDGRHRDKMAVFFRFK